MDSIPCAERLREVVALAELAAEVDQLIDLVAKLNSFCHSLKPEGVPELDHGLGQCGVIPTIRSQRRSSLEEPPSLRRLVEETKERGARSLVLDRRSRPRGRGVLDVGKENTATVPVARSHLKFLKNACSQ
jgi:hypothetical protein